MFFFLLLFFAAAFVSTRPLDEPAANVTDSGTFFYRLNGRSPPKASLAMNSSITTLLSQRFDKVASDDPIVTYRNEQESTYMVLTLKLWTRYLPRLSYSLDSLQPYISFETMNLHYNTLHKGIVDNINKASEQFLNALNDNDLRQQATLAAQLKELHDADINHSIYWQSLSPHKTSPDQSLTKQINRDFGSFDAMLQQISDTATSFDTSGWVWLGYSSHDKALEVIMTPDQKLLETHTPLIGIDLFEHSYYLDRHTSRADYISNITHVLDWTRASQLYSQIRS